MGRPRKPHSLVVYEGKRGHRPVGTEPQLRPTPPSCPDWMPRYGAEMWEKLLGQLGYVRGLLVEADWLIFELACSAYAEWRECMDVVREKGRTYESLVVLGEDGQPVDIEAARIVQRERPEVRLAARAREALDGYLGKLGLSPADRARLVVPSPQFAGTLLDRDG